MTHFKEKWLECNHEKHCVDQVFIKNKMIQVMTDVMVYQQKFPGCHTDESTMKTFSVN